MVIFEHKVNILGGRLSGVAFNIGVGTFSSRDNWISFYDHKVQIIGRWGFWTLYTAI